MASIREAYNTFLLNCEGANCMLDKNIVGVLQGKVVNTTYNIYKIEDAYFVIVDGKRQTLNLSGREDHGKEIEVPLIGWKYKVFLF